MKYVILSLVFFVISILAPAVAAAMAKIPVQLVFKRAGLPRKIELSPRLRSEIERITHGTGIGEELMQVGNLQEVVWQLREMGAGQQSEELTLLLRDTLENAEIVAMEDIGVGRSGAQLVKFANGLRGVFKTEHTDEDKFIREVMVYHFDRLIGTHVFPLTTLRVIDGEEGSMQLFIENSMSAFDIVEKRLDMMEERRDIYSLDRIADILEVESPNVKTLKLLTLNSDHINPQNYLFPFAGRIVAIDGSRSFSGRGDAVKEIVRHLRASPDAYNLDPTLVSQLVGVSSTLTEVDDALLSLLPLKEIENFLAIPYEYEFERYVNISSSKYWKEFRHIDFVRRAIDEYIVAVPTTDPKLPERLKTALQHGKFDNARALLDNGLSGDIALEDALASHDVRAADWLLEQGYQHKPDRMDIHLESAIESKNWQFVDWVLLEKKLVHTYSLENIEDYLQAAWKRKNFAAIFAWGMKKYSIGATHIFIVEPLDEALGKKDFANAMLILEKVKMVNSIILYKSTVSRIIEAAMKAKKYNVTKQVADDVVRIVGDENPYGFDFLQHPYSNYVNLEDYKKNMGLVLDSGLYENDSFYNIVNKAIKDGRVADVRFLLRKHFATNDPSKITDRLLASGKHDIAKYWFQKVNRGKRHEILAHIVRRNEKNYQAYFDNIKEFSHNHSSVEKNALKFSLVKEDFIAANRLTKNSSWAANALLDVLNEAESWKFMVWLLENGDIDMVMDSALRKNNFEIANWILENIDIEKTKKLAEALDEYVVYYFFKNLEIRIERDLYRCLLSEKPARIPEKYKPLLNFLLPIVPNDEWHINEFESRILNEIKQLETRRVAEHIPHKTGSKYTAAIHTVMAGGDLQSAASLLSTKNVYENALRATIVNENYFTFVEWLVSLFRHSDVLVSALNFWEASSWEFIGWLLENGRVDGVMYAALRENDFEIANWLLENIDAEKTKKLAEALKDNDGNVLASSLRSLQGRIERDLHIIFITSGGYNSNDLEHILERYRPLLSFLFGNTNSTDESIDKFAERIFLRVAAE